MEILTCVVCLSKAVNAHMCPHCSKLSCEGCIRDWLETRKGECPHCKRPLKLKELVNCSSLAREIQEVLGFPRRNWRCSPRRSRKRSSAASTRPASSTTARAASCPCARSAPSSNPTYAPPHSAQGPRVRQAHERARQDRGAAPAEPGGAVRPAEVAQRRAGARVEDGAQPAGGQGG